MSTQPLPPKELFELPGDFSLKVMGRSHSDFEAFVLATIREHGGILAEADPISKRPSKQGNFTALTVTFYIEQRQQLDKIYQALNDHDDVVMTL